MVGSCVWMRPSSCATVGCASTYQRMRSRVIGRGLPRNSVPGSRLRSVIVLSSGRFAGLLAVGKYHLVTVADQQLVRFDPLQFHFECQILPPLFGVPVADLALHAEPVADLDLTQNF